MRHSSHPSRKTRQVRSDLPVSDLPRLLEAFLMSGDISQHSKRTLTNRRDRIQAFINWCQSAEVEYADVAAIRGYLHHMRHRHEPKKGVPKPTGRMAKPLTSGTIKSHHSSLRTFFNWLVTEQELDESPVERVPPPIDRPDQVQPFTPEQLEALLKQARNPAFEHTGRNEAIFYVMLDTGIRSEELRDLLVEDVDTLSNLIHIRSGKGGKGRYVPFSQTTKRALLRYINHRAAEAHETLFISERGLTTGEPLVSRGLCLMVKKWGEKAGLKGVRCSPHTFRHTFAIEFLRAGGNVFTLKEILGHTSLTMVNRYVALAQADISRQHAQFSPVNRMRGKR